jgi:hypothetical protein
VHQQWQWTVDVQTIPRCSDQWLTYWAIYGLVTESRVSKWLGGIKCTQLQMEVQRSSGLEGGIARKEQAQSLRLIPIKCGRRGGLHSPRTLQPSPGYAPALLRHVPWLGRWMQSFPQRHCCRQPQRRTGEGHLCRMRSEATLRDCDQNHVRLDCA